MPSKLSSSVNEVQTGKFCVKSDVTLPSSTQTPVCSRTFKSGRLEMIGFERYRVGRFSSGYDASSQQVIILLRPKKKPKAKVNRTDRNSIETGRTTV